MQVSCELYPERAEEIVVCENPEVSMAGVSRIATAEEESKVNTIKKPAIVSVY